MDVSTLFDEEETLEAPDCDFSVVVAQLDSRLGDMAGNCEKALETLDFLRETDRKPDLLVLPP